MDVTLAENVQDDEEGSDPFAIDEEFAFAAAVTVAPAQLVAPAGDAVLSRPLGYGSLAEIPVSESVGLGFWTVTVSRLLPPEGMEFGEKDLVTIGEHSAPE